MRPAAPGDGRCPGWSWRARLATVAAVAVAVAGGVVTVVGLSVHRAPTAAPLPPPVAAQSITGDASAPPPPARTPTRTGPAPGTLDRLPSPLPAPDRDAGTGSRAPTALPVPVPQTGMPARSVRIPSQHVTATIGAATVVDGVLTPPRIPDTVGKWAGSAPLDAATGEVTLAGHVNWAGMPRFAFADLAYLRPGELLYTTDDRARVTAWRITRVYARPKTEPIDAAAFAGATGPRRLTLITCGGSFDPGDASYDDNVYVTATPASAS